MSNPRIIAATASAALIAGAGAGAAVYALEIATGADSSQASSTQAEDAGTLSAPQDDKTTVYRSPGDDDDDEYDDSATGQTIQPAPADTSWNSNGGGKTKSNTSKSS